MARGSRADLNNVMTPDGQTDVQTNAQIQEGLQEQMQEQKPQHKFLFIVNPVSGRSKAMHIFDDKVRPVLMANQCDFDVLITERANHAMETMMTIDLTKYYGIIVVSGDGMLYEVVNGIMRREDVESSGIIGVSLGIIPGGSGNGLAYAINHAYSTLQGVKSPDPLFDSILHSIHGIPEPMDLIKVTTQKGCFYSFLSIGWGLLSDIDIESETLRMIGKQRFTLWGLLRALTLRKYHAKLSYLLADNGRSDTSNNLNGQSYSNGSGCKHSSDSHFKCSSCNSSCKSNAMTNADPNTNHSDQYVPPLDSPIDSHASYSSSPGLGTPGWVTIEDEFVMVHSAYQTHISSTAIFAPDAHFADGLIWLSYIRGNVTRKQVVKFLTSLDKGKHVRLPYVTMVPVKAYRMEPTNNLGKLTIDGEIIECCPFQAEIMPKIANILIR